MCGITGFVVKKGPAPERAILESMNAAIFHRGPDEGGLSPASGVLVVSRADGGCAAAIMHKVDATTVNPHRVKD